MSSSIRTCAYVARSSGAASAAAATFARSRAGSKTRIPCSRLYAATPSEDLRPLGEEREELAVDPVNLLPQLRELGHGFLLVVAPVV